MQGVRACAIRAAQLAPMPCRDRAGSRPAASDLLCFAKESHQRKATARGRPALSLRLPLRCRASAGQARNSLPAVAQTRTPHCPAAAPHRRGVPGRTTTCAVPVAAAPLLHRLRRRRAALKREVDERKRRSRSETQREQAHSVPEVPHSREHHRHASLVGRRDDFLIAHAAARLDHAGGPGIDDDIEAVTEREERVRGGCRAGQ